MADIIAKARARRQHLLAEIEKIDTFLALAAEFSEGEAPDAPQPPARPRVRVRHRKPPEKGVVRETANVIRDYMRAYGEGHKTRDLVAVVEDAGVEVGGQDKIATLSARISTSKMFELRQGKWFIRQSAGEETTDNPTKDQSAASLFHQQGERRDAAALTD